MTSAIVFDDRVCKLGEGPLWHPQRKQLFWFDILGKTLLSQDGGGMTEWAFDEHVSAAGWVDQDTLLIASETQLLRFDIPTGTHTQICELEADDPVTRSNDGRADPWGGFWIGTMGKHAESGAGAIYRYFKGTLKQLVPGISVSNAICFHEQTAFFTDTLTKCVMKQALDPNSGWPVGDAAIHLDLNADGLNPDGAVTDKLGNLWLAEWGSARIACYAPDGTRKKTVFAQADQTSCPAWGGTDFTDLYITSAAVGLSAEHKEKNPNTGKTFVAKNVGQGRPEPRVIL